MLDIELVWLTAPIAGIFSQIGGYRWKIFRRLLIAVLLVGAWLYFKGSSWMILLFGIAQCAVYTLPFTLTGDAVDNAFDFAWIPVKGLFMCAPTLILDVRVWPAMIVCALIWAVMAALGNVNATKKYFPWKLVEIYHGMMPAICFCYAANGCFLN